MIRYRELKKKPARFRSFTGRTIKAVPIGGAQSGSRKLVESVEKW